MAIMTLEANSDCIDRKLEAIGRQHEVLASHTRRGRGVDLDVVELKQDLRIRLLIRHAGF